MPTSIGVLILILIIPIALIVHSNRKKTIEDMIISIGGEIISIERRNFFNGIGPFYVVGKGRAVYRISYLLDGEEKEGWVRFGSLFGPDWRL